MVLLRFLRFGSFTPRKKRGVNSKPVAKNVSAHLHIEGAVRNVGYDQSNIAEVL